MYLCALCGSQNKQRLIPYTALNDVFINVTQCVYCAIRAECLWIIHVNCSF